MAVDGVLVSTAAQGGERVAALLEQAQTRGIAVQEVTDAEFLSAADTEQPQGVLAVAQIPTWPLPSPGAAFRVLVLDAVQDPGNAGTLVRTAAALGVNATFALPGTVDLWNAKVVRSSMGALFHHPVHVMTWEQLAEWAARHDVALWGGDMHGDDITTVPRPLPSRLGLVVSNEGAGLSPDAGALLGRQLAIPMAPGTESLNVAVATGILLHTLRV